MARATVVEATTERRRRWQVVVRRFERSGLSVAEFCKAESLSAWSLYDWRRKLGGASRGRRSEDVNGAGFVDVGAVRAPRVEERNVAAPSIEVPVGLELRIDLGGGLVLQIVRR
jgi:hypothetical protein